MCSVWAAILTVCVILIAFGQTPRERFNVYYAQVKQLREQARTAFDREMAQEKAGDCPNAVATRDVVDCLRQAVETTTGNHDAYTRVLGSILALRPDADDQNAGEPIGRALRPAELAKEFDDAGAAWEKYRQAQCSAAFNQFKGGTIAPVMQQTCHLLLLRSHMRDLDQIYSTALRN